MKDQTKTAGAVLIGYLLGRTKQGGRALRVTMWATGNTGGPQTLDFVRKNGAALLGSDEAKAIITQVQGPLRDAMIRAALSRVTGAASGLTSKINERTQALTGTLEGTASDVTDTVKESTSKVTDTVTGLGRPKAESDESEDEGQEDAEDEENQDDGGDQSDNKDEGEGHA